jgi:hypothetical protein
MEVLPRARTSARELFMTFVLRLAVGLAAATPVLSATANAQQPATPIRAMTQDAVRRAVEATAWPGVTHADAPRSATESDWSRVREIEGEEIALTLVGMPAVTRYIVADSVNDSGFTVLNLTDPRIPARAREALADAAWWHPECFLRPQPVGGSCLDKHVRIEAGSVFVDGTKVSDLADIVEQVARARVAEITYVHRTATRGLVWGALLGAAAGVAIVTVNCGTHWNTETPSCPNLTGAWLFLAPGYGAGIGAAIGAGVKVTRVAYRAPHTGS